MKISAHSVQPSTRQAGHVKTPWRSIPLIAWWYLTTMVISGLLIGLQSISGIDSRYISVVQFAPAIGVCVVLAAFRKRRTWAGPSRLNAQSFWLRCVSSIAVIALYSAFVVVTAIVFNAQRDDLPFASGWLLLLYVLLQIAGSCGEEIGWRGFVQPALETRMPRLAACVVTGVLWAVWHVQMFTDLLGAFAFVLACISLSILFSYMVGGSIWQRGLIAGMMHAIVNITLFFAIDPRNAAFENIPLSVVFLIVCALTRVVWQRTYGTGRGHTNA